MKTMNGWKAYAIACARDVEHLSNVTQYCLDEAERSGDLSEAAAYLRGEMKKTRQVTAYRVAKAALAAVECANAVDVASARKSATEAAQMAVAAEAAAAGALYDKIAETQDGDVRATICTVAAAAAVDRQRMALAEVA